MRVFYLLILLCLQTVFLSAQSAAPPSSQAFMVKLNYVDPENPYNSNFHFVQTKLAELEGLQSFLFVEEENAFLVRTLPSVSVLELRAATGGEMEVHSLPADDYQRYWNQQFALKLALRKGKGAPNDPSFPQYVASGNDTQDQATYRALVIRWLQDHPMTNESTTVNPTNKNSLNTK